MSKREGIMLAHPFEEKRLLRDFPPDILVQPKLDGIRCRAVRTEHSTILISSEGHRITSLPCIEKALEAIDRTIWSPYSFELDGEVYTHGMPFERIVSYAKRHEPKAGHECIQYHIFDKIDKEFSLTNYSRNMHLSHLAAYLKESGASADQICFVETEMISSTLSHLYSKLDRYIEMGYEGVIVRNPIGLYEKKRSKNMLKIKPRKEDIYYIIGVEEEISISGEPKGRLGALICEKDGQQFNIGSGFTQAQRIALWNNRPIGRRVVVKYQALTTDRGVPRFPIFAEIVE